MRNFSPSLRRVTTIYIPPPRLSIIRPLLRVLRSYLSVRNHHGHASELDFQIFRQLLATGVTGVHGYKNAELGVEWVRLAVAENTFIRGMVRLFFHFVSER